MNKIAGLDLNGIVHKSFKVGILLKAIDGILEIIGGILLLFLNPIRFSRLSNFLTHRELSEDPRDIIANSILKLSSKFTVNTQYFGVFYLMTHGLIKIVLVVLLWQKKVWAYPLTIILLSLFVIYQVYRYTIHHSTGLILLTLLDVIVIILTFIEYMRIKNSVI